MTDLQDRLQQELGDAYEIERELGGGGMSRVLVARDRKLGRRVVVKLLKPELAVGVSADRFRREILLAAALQHPHIVPILSAGELDDLPFFLMPFIEGESLRQRVASGPLPVLETVRILRDVARALGAAHAIGIVHRDIKPDNVLLAGGSAMVADFGVAKALVSARREHHHNEHSDATITTAGTSLGTPAYMAPEQVAADPNMDHRADIYAVGVMAYEMLTGAPPFTGRSPQQVMAAHLSEPVAPITRPGIPQALADLVMRCLEKEPSQRPQTAEELLAALENPAVVSGAFVSAPELHAIARGARRRRAVTVAAILAVSGSVTLWLARQGAEPGAVSLAGNAAVTAPAKVAPSIAVLPLAYLGADKTHAYIADGIANSVTSSLSRVSGLRVASRAFATALQQRIAAGTATDTAVTSIIEGVVEEERGVLRIAIRLVDARDGFTVWSDQFEGDRKSLFEMQDRIASAVSTAMAEHFALPLDTISAPAAGTGALVQ